MGVSDAINELTYRIIGCCIAVHSALGPGLLESAYLACLIVELRSAGLDVEVNVKVPIVYKGVTVDCCYRLDLLINGTVILEIKSVAALLPIHGAQLVTYLKLTGKPIGLLVNFNVPLLTQNGIVRKINTKDKALQ